MRTIKSQTAKILLGLPFNLPQGIARIIRHEKAERDAQPPRSQSEGYTERQERIIALVEDCYEVTAGMVAADEQIAEAGGSVTLKAAFKLAGAGKAHLAKLVEDGILTQSNLARTGMAPCIIWRMADAAKTEETGKEAA